MNLVGFHGGIRRGAGGRYGHSSSNSLSTSLFRLFDFRLPFYNLMGNAGKLYFSWSSFTSFDGLSGNTAMIRTSTLTRFIGGKKITTKNKYNVYLVRSSDTVTFLLIIFLIFPLSCFLQNLWEGKRNDNIINCFTFVSSFLRIQGNFPVDYILYFIQYSLIWQKFINW